MPMFSRRPVRVWAKMACRYLKDGGRAGALERLGSIVEVSHDSLKMERQAEFQCELEIRRLDDLKEEPPQPSQYSSPHLGVGPIMSEIAPPRVPKGTQGKGDRSQRTMRILLREYLMHECMWILGAHGRAPNFCPCVSRFLNSGVPDIRFTPVFLGRMGIHDRVARPCLASFTSPTPVYDSPCPC
ncbi:hypothetical protein GOBAR_AA01663 [Gossypium barbadense]|uniref:Uncharacterized protein n=1 Tax=Gossypium barbadense TaxID=3634 RepID=A0A2P5YTL5_GOSBA|nr:hypothetical protein GOBAR_AA01663 [Gossypium barbadense]